MKNSWPSLWNDYDIIVRKTVGWLKSCDPEIATAIDQSLTEYGIPWRSICGVFGGSPSAIPEDVVHVALDSYLLRIAVAAILADGVVSDVELETAWPLTSKLAASVGNHFSDLQGFDHRTYDGHCAFLDTFHKKNGWFGGSCDWTIDAAILLVLYASLLEDAANSDSRERRALFLSFRELSSSIVRNIILADGVSDAEAHLLEQLDLLFTRLLATQSPIHEHESNARFDSGHSEIKDVAHDTFNAAIGQVALSREDALDAALKELNSLIGLAGVKQEVSRLTSFLQVQEQRRRQQLKTSSQTLHFVFMGNPGTGKTSVARILSKIFYGFGLLQTAHLVECDRSQLVGGYVGQTAIKTADVIKSALDGILFIDEAYTLSRGSTGNDYGEEAINTLLKSMEDYRDRLIVIVAGYPKLMGEFIHVNPGLESRFTRFITFEDYSVEELCQVFDKFTTDDEYVLSSGCRGLLSVLFTAAYSRRDDRFGNARFVRNVFESAVAIHSERLSMEKVDNVTKEELSTLRSNDVFSLAAKELGVEQLDLTSTRWRFACPHCGHSGNEDGRFLGRRVKCKCGSSFTFPWWDVIPATVPPLASCMERSENPFQKRT